MLKHLAVLLDPASRRQYALLAILSVLSSLLQTVGVAAISLFFTVLLGGKLPAMAQAMVDHYDFVFLGFLVLLAALSGTLSSGLVTYFGIKLSWRQYERISSLLLQRFLSNPYEWHLQRNSSELTNAVLTEAKSVGSILQNCVLVMVKSTEILFLTALLFVAKPYVAMVAFFSFATIYWMLFRLNRGIVRNQGRLLVQANGDSQKSVAEALGGIKAVKVAGNALYFQQRFQEAARRAVRATANVQYFSLMPKYFIEILLFGGLVGFVVVSQLRHWGVFESIPLIALYGAAALRMLPAAQQLYYSVINLVAGQRVLEKIAEELSDEALSSSSPIDREILETDSEELLALQQVCYRYPNAHQVSIQDVSVTIERGEKVGIVGSTGAGKTTLVDLLLGLLAPNEGRIAVARQESGREHLVAYVPQQIHFLDDTIAANIAWGVPPEKRDRQKIELAAQKARIHQHIESLPQKYDSMMGERGLRLSGGQLQRIGIARALYLDPALLVLDEASNALDAETEGQVLNSLFEQDLTILVIAHRLSTLRSCSRLLVLQDGTIVAQGTYDQLLETSPYFKRLAEADGGFLNDGGGS